jgi:predicted DCC family thiol-disulfide oxidoreductase YuxK
LFVRVPPRRELGLGAAPFFGLTWLLLAAACAASGVWHWREDARVFAAFEFACVALAFAPPLRPAVWSAACLAQIAWALLGRGLPPASAPPLLLAFAFDPAWIGARRAAAPHVVYYDGACGFCHANVRLLLREDRDGTAFRFAPLQGARFAREVPAAARAGLPDSIVLRTDDGRLLTKSAALLEIGDALGGLWRLLAALGRWIPRPLRDAAYDAVARVRGRLFRKPDGLCPRLPPGWASRFDLD